MTRAARVQAQPGGTKVEAKDPSAPSALHGLTAGGNAAFAAAVLARTPATAPSKAPEPVPSPTDRGGERADPCPPPIGMPDGTKPSPDPRTPDRGTAAAKPPAPEPAGAAELDSGLAAEFEKRADPSAKAHLSKLKGGADTARLASLQYSFYTSDLATMVRESVFPMDAATDHIRAATTTNAYASSASFGSASGWIGGLQTGIECGRQITGVLGDVIGGASSGLGVLAGISASAALSGPLAVIAAPLAAASATAGEMLAIAKAGADMINVQLGLVQLLLSVLRSQLSVDPADRARIAQLIKKESSEIGQSLMSAALGAASIGVGKGLGKLGGRTAAAEAESLGKMTVSEFRANARPLVASGRTGLRVPAFKATVLRTGTRMAPQAPRVVMERLKMTRIPWARPAIATVRPALTGTGSGAAGVGIGIGASRVKVETNRPADETGSNAPTQNNAAATSGPRENITTRKVSFWPDVLAELKSERERIANAQERMYDQHKLANDEAGSMRVAVTKLYGHPARYGELLRVEGGSIQAQANDSASKSTAAAQHAKNAKEKGEEAAKKLKEGEHKKDELKQKGEQVAGAKGAGTVKVDKSLAEQAKDLVLSKGLAKVQAAISKAIMSWAFDLAGITNMDRDLAGIERENTQAKDTDKQAAADGAGAQAQAPVVDKAFAELTKGATDQQRNAMAGMADTLEWMRKLEGWDRSLEQTITDGDAYIARTAPVLKAELGADQGGTVTEAHLAPFREGCATLEHDMDDAEHEASARFDKDLDASAAALDAVYSKYFTDFPRERYKAAGKESASELTGQLRTSLAGHKQDATRLSARASALAGKPAIDEFKALQDELERLGQAIEATFERAVNAFDEVMTKMEANVDKDATEAAQAAPPRAAPEEPKP